MKLKQLLSVLPSAVIKGSKELFVTGICADSRRVAPGNLFVARKGERFDGGVFIEEAVQAGAIAVLTDLYNPTLKGVVQVIVSDVLAAQGALAARYYGEASRDLFVVGVTGTNGKTTVSYCIRYLLEKAAQIRCGLIGGLEIISGDKSYPAQMTTPDVLFNHKILCDMKLQECSAAVMEVSSHALMQGRVSNIEYSVGLFTNLTPEHLDYHGSMEAYAVAKRRLFDGLSERGVAIINGDDPYATSMVRSTKARIFKYGLGEDVDLRASQLSWDSDGLRGIVSFGAEELPFHIPLIGVHSGYNFLAALAVGIAYGLPLGCLINAGASLPQVSGRLEFVPNALDLPIYVDYAHKDDALKAVLEALRPLCRGKIIVVFGCGGDRDRLKRPRLAAVAEHYADSAIVTNDNPRNEAPEAIAEEIIAGFSAQANFFIELDRREAIRRAIELMGIDDLLLIAGRGAEREQLFAKRSVPFDDREVVRELCLYADTKGRRG